MLLEVAGFLEAAGTEVTLVRSVHTAGIAQVVSVQIVSGRLLNQPCVCYQYRLLEAMNNL